VERWFRELTTDCVRRGAFFSVEDLQRAIAEFLAAWNEAPKGVRINKLYIYKRMM
jgi:hypothetical protein